MQTAIAQIGAEGAPPLGICIGLHTGAAVAGVGGISRFANDLWGDTVNTASRMESHGQPGRSHISHDTNVLLHGRFEMEAGGEG